MAYSDEPLFIETVKTHGGTLFVIDKETGDITFAPLEVTR